jgi:hypothetical protein
LSVLPGCQRRPRASDSKRCSELFLLRRCLALSGLCAALLLIPAAGASAGWFPGEVIDGPNPGLV